MTQQNISTMQDILDALEQNPDLQREFHKHVVDVIRNDNAIRQDLRKEILTEELLLLPARFTRLEEDASEIRGDVSELKSDVSQLRTDVDELKTDVSQLRTDVDELKTDVSELRTDVNEIKTDVSELRTDVNELRTDVNKISGQVANLTGSDYETKAIEQSRRMVRGRLDMDKATVIFAARWDASEFEADVLMPAIRDGRITRQEAEQVEAADSIVHCEDQQGNVVCAVIEISVTVQDDDRSRATERAEIFGRATGWRTVPFVVGQEEQEAAAGTADVPFLQYSP